VSAKVQAAVLNSVAGSAGTIPLAATGASVTIGNTIIVGFSWDRSTGATLSPVADGLGNVYTQLTNSPINDATSTQALSIWMAPVTVAGTASIVGTLSVNAPFRSGCAVELSSVGTLDVVATATNHGSAGTGTDGMSDGSVTPSASGATVIAVGDIHGGATMTAGTGWTQDTTSGASGASVSIERQDLGAATLTTGKWTTGVADFFNALTFSLSAPAGAAATGSTFIPHRMPLGV
jgi:hypothetical protein